MRAFGKIIAQRPPLPGRQAGALVPGLPLGAGRGGGRVRGQDLAGDRRRVPRGRRGGSRRAHRHRRRPSSRTRRSTSSSGPPRPGRCPPTRRWRCTRSSTTCWSRSAARRTAQRADRSRPSSSSPCLQRYGVAACDGARATSRAGRSRDCSSRIRSTSGRCRSILGEHVTLDAGTGAVHTAPGARPGGLRRRPALRSAGGQSGGRRRPLPPDTPLVAGLQGR